MATSITTISASDTGTTVVEVCNANFTKRMWPTVVSVTTTYTVLTGDSYVVLCDATGGAFTVTLPAAASSTNIQVTLKKTDVSANAVTIDGDGAETIDGAATQSLATQWKTKTLVCNGTAWFILSDL